jgi:hypothetical protein
MTINLLFTVGQLDFYGMAMVTVMALGFVWAE